MDCSDALYMGCDRCREATLNPDPVSLCYYHRKIHDGLIDDPEIEMAHTEINAEADMPAIYAEVVEQLVKKTVVPEWQEHARGYVGRYYAYTVRKWDGNLSSWKTFCYHVIRMRLINFIVKEKRYTDRHRIGFQTDQILENEQHEPDALVISKEAVDALRESITSALPKLTTRQKYILWQRMVSHQPETQQDIADRFGVSQKMVSKDEAAIRQLLRENYHDEI